MSYDFSFDKKSAFLILAGCIAIGALLFSAGLVVGWDRGVYAARAQFEKDNASKLAKAAAPVHDTSTNRDAAEKENKSVAVTDSRLSEPNADKEPAPKMADQAPASDSPRAETVSKPGSVAANANLPSNRDSMPSAKPVSLTSSASSNQTTSNQEDGAAADAAAFSLQLGAFKNQDNALRFERSLKTRGYSVFVFDTLDAGGHVWHAVRMGHFPDAKTASAAAAVFAGKEKISVFVRPGNEL